MPEEDKKIKVVRVKNIRMKSLKIKSTGPKPLITKNLTLEEIGK